MAEMVLCERADGVATVTMNRPQRLNTMTDAFLEELLGALERAADAPDVRVVVLRGSGKAFCAGGDLKEGIGGGVGGRGGITTATGNLRRYMRTAQLLREMPKPTIAAVHGACAGAGLSLACAADLRLASRSAVFATAFVTVGLSGDFGGTWTLSRIVGSARARQAYLLSDRIDADTALAWGLVSEVTGDDEALWARAAELAGRLAAGPSGALRAVKANVNDAEEVTFAEALEREAARHIAASRTEEAAEATRAFLEKRPPVFR
ncbi:enoyl-CoA hydratase [Actinomadura sp. B10D3]|uniref:enoyl-CoA hydratase n=1 Tax=Actinomadura sp. B10D3 TaxID=3153557 RepID=UPI00325D749E